jgi:salicylate hydroxylase
MPRIAIAGAGVAGLATALALRREGFDIVVLEQASRLAEVGAGLQLSPNGTRVLRWLGIDGALEPLACEARAKEVRLWNTGQRWTLFDLGEDCRARFGAPYWMVHRADLQSVLLRALEAAAPGALRLGARIVGATSHADQVDIALDNGELLQADALVAADGVHSALRTAVAAGVAPARYTGLLAWRGLVPTDRLPAGLRAPVGTNWVGPGGHVITYPLRAGALMNVVGITEHAGWTSESWMEPGSHEDLLGAFGHWHSDVRTLMQAIGQPYRWALLARPPRPGWSTGRIVLAGDAAHPTLPFLAQGANMALEDACVLARCLAAWPVPEAFARFEALRWERTSTIVDRSADNAARFHDARLADPSAAVAYVDSEWDPEKVRRRYDWLFAYDATTVAA